MNRSPDTLFVEQQGENENLFRKLQKQALAAYQRLCGEVWTDYNIHDPGVTLSDVLNYALTELDYRLRFDWKDYLTDPDGAFDAERYGFFPAAQVYPVSPVTADDYRKYLLSELPEIDNVRIRVSDTSPDRYRIDFDLSPFQSETDPEAICRRIARLYHWRRNLCEELEEVRPVRWKRISLSGDIHVGRGIDHLTLLAEIYWTAYAFLAGYPRFFSFANDDGEPVPPEQRFDGPLNNGIGIEVRSYPPYPTESQLYFLLKSVPGVRAIFSMLLKDENKQIVNRFEEPYMLIIPQTPEEMQVRLLVENTEVKISPRRLGAEVRRLYFRYKGTRPPAQADSPEADGRPGTYRDLSLYRSVQDDLPPVYGTGREGISENETDWRKAQANQLKAYLLLCDLTLLRGLNELQEFRTLLEQNAVYPAGRVPQPADPVYRWDRLTDPARTAAWTARNTRRQKERLLDYWDKLYGEDSRPAWLTDFLLYDETPEDAVERRIGFLKKAPCWGRDRFRAISLVPHAGPDNRSGMERYVAALLGWSDHEGHAAGNLFALYNLILVEDDLYFNPSGIVPGITLMHDFDIRGKNLEPVPFLPVTDDDIHFLQLRRELPFFQQNMLFTSLFHEGIRIDRFRIVTLEEADGCLLVFQSEKIRFRVNLGRFSDREKLIRVANRLRRFLRWLNLRSETLYLIEHQYFREPEPFALTAVLPGWSVRTADPHFREAFASWLTGRLPAHIRIRFRWLDIDELWRFEYNRSEWLKKYTGGEKEAARNHMDTIQTILT